MIFNRVWAMPDSDTFSITPIGSFVRRYLGASQSSIDPFARNKRWATHTNDLNPQTSAEYHLDAEEFCLTLFTAGVSCDLALFDPPYSPRQISECYKEAGFPVTGKDTQNAALYSRVRNALLSILSPEAVVLSFGWNSVGMGRKNGFEILEILLICHGGAHNDTICLAERRLPSPPDFFSLVAPSPAGDAQ